MNESHAKVAKPLEFVVGMGVRGKLPPMMNFRKGAAWVTLMGTMICTVNVEAQVGTEFWFVAPEIAVQHEDIPVQIRVATFENDAQVTLTMPANPDFDPIEVSIAANDATSILLTNWLDVIENKPFNQVLNKGLLLESTSNISAYYEVGQTFNPDIFALKGQNALGLSFHLPFQNFTSNGYSNSPSGFDVVATEDNTIVTITPTVDLVGHEAGTPYEVVLPFAGSTYSARAAGTAAANHAVGTVVTADKPVAITLHDDSCSGALFGGCADLMGDQLVPDDILGTEYVAVHGYLGGDDRIQILATENNTTVTVDGALVATLQAGEAHQHVLNTPSAFIETSAPTAVWQSTGFGCELGGAQLPSVKCTGSFSSVFVRSTAETMRLNVLVPAGGEGDFLFNGNPGILNASMFAVVPGNPNWMFAQVTTLEGSILVGEATRIENTSTAFHLGIINGGSNTGTRYGYFSDYGALKYQAVNQTLHPCLGSPLTLEVDPIENGLYQWSGPNNFAATGLSVDLGVATTTLSGTYVVQGYTGECAIEDDTINVQVHTPLGPPSLTGDLEACEGVTVTFGAEQQNVSWVGPNGYESTGAYVVLTDINEADAGVYVATMSDPYCPSQSDSLVLSLLTAEDLAVSWEDEREFCPGENDWASIPGELALDGTEVQWWWFPDSGSDPELVSTEMSLILENPGTYVVETTGPGPCVVTGNGIVEVTFANCNLRIPNVITPGNDDLNNRFVVTNLRQFPQSTIQIFNRWGNQVFEHENFGDTAGWLPEASMSEGIYYYTLVIRRQDQRISITTEAGTLDYIEPGDIRLHGSFTVLK